MVYVTSSERSDGVEAIKRVPAPECRKQSFRCGLSYWEAHPTQHSAGWEAACRHGPFGDCRTPVTTCRTACDDQPGRVSSNIRMEPESARDSDGRPADRWTPFLARFPSSSELYVRTTKNVKQFHRKVFVVRTYNSDELNPTHAALLNLIPYKWYM